jgi:general secretion pathway protein H
MSATGIERVAVNGSRRFAEHGFTSLRRSAEHGFTSLKRSAEHGFTLVEMMVVLVIMGLASATVLLAMPDPRGDLRADGERFAARAKAAQDAAIIEAREMALWVNGSGYGFERRERGQWVPVSDRPFRQEAWPEGATVSAGAGGSGRTAFDTTGLAEPLNVTLSRDGASIAITIGADGSIHVG